MTTADYAFIAWNPVTVMIGSSIRDKATHKQLELDWQPGLIRNCTFAPGPRIVGTTAEDRTNGGQVLNLFSIDQGKTVKRFPFDTVLNHALVSDGNSAAIALPSADRMSADLELIDTKNGRSERLVTGRLHHSSTISWFPDDQQIAYQTVDDQIELVHRSTREIAPVTRGHAPAVSPDGQAIACERDGKLHLWERATGDERSIDTGRATPSTNLSWSPYGRFLTFGSTRGLSGKETQFYLYELATGNREDLPLKFATGLSLISETTGAGKEMSDV